MTTKEQRLHDWQARIADYRASGLTMSSWCQAHSISKEQLKYWLRKTKHLETPSSESTTRWLPLSVSPDVPLATPLLIVRIGHASIEIKENFDPHLLRQVVLALEPSC